MPWSPFEQHQQPATAVISPPNPQALLDDYQSWSQERHRLAQAEDSPHPPDPDDWHASDDQAVDLLAQFADLVGQMEHTT